MLYALRRGWPLMRVPLQHLEDEVDGFARGAWNDRCEGRYGAAREVNPPIRRQLITLLPVRRRGAKDEAELHELVSL